MKVTKKIKINKKTSLILWDEQSPNIRRNGSDIRSWADFREQFSWEKRCKKHKIVQSIVRFIIKKIAMYLLHQKEKRSYDYIYDKAKIVYKPEGIDFYTYCHDKSTKKYCHGGTMFWACYIHEYSFLAHTEYGLYLEIIRRIILEPVNFPFA